MTGEMRMFLALGVMAQIGGALAISFGLYASAFVAMTIFIAAMFGIAIVEITNCIHNQKGTE